MSKPFARKFYDSKTWQNCRNAYARSVGFLCEDCLERGLIVPGDIVHHMIELTPQNINDPEVTLNFKNLRFVCRNCHAERHKNRNKGRRYYFGEDGEVVITE